MTRDSDALADVIEAWLDIAPAAEDPGSVLDRVVAELETTRQQRPSWLALWTVNVNRFIAVGLATGAVLVAALIGLQVFGGPSLGGPGPGAPDPTESPTPSPVPSASPGPVDVSYRDVGFIGPPPPGFAPSKPGRSELVGTIGMVWRPDFPYTGNARLYADGRLIWFEYTVGNPPYSSTGYLEQRLTREGVELLQTLAGEPGEGLPDFRVPSDRLPATAWEDATIRPYIPSGFGVCLVVTDHEQNLEDLAAPLNEKLSMLPVEAADLLRGRAPIPSSDYPPPSHDCLEVPLDEARLLDATLRTAGMEQDEQANLYLLEYHVDLDGDGPGTRQLTILFESILPDGTISCTGCG